MVIIMFLDDMVYNADLNLGHAIAIVIILCICNDMDIKCQYILSITVE